MRIWYETPDVETGEIITRASLSNKTVDWRSVWPLCAETPVTVASYQFHGREGKWPDEIVPEKAGSNFAAADDDEQRMASVAALEIEAIAWFESIGAEIKTQADADKAANFADAFLRHENSALASCREACEPAKREIAEIETKWRPISVRARDSKIAIKNQWLKPFLERRAGERKKSLAEQATSPSVLATPKAGSSDGRRVSAWVASKAYVADWHAFGMWLLALKEPPVTFLSALQKIARQFHTRGLKDMPGIEIKEETQVR